MKILGIIIVVLLLGGIMGVFLESNMKKNLPKVVGQMAVPITKSDTEGIFNASTPAPELTGITAWLNTDKPFTLHSFRGKVVLVDFWTNQCINCIHTLPYVTKWYNTYSDQGFVVVGVHTPELAYEYTISSIKTAIQTYGIKYPVAQDNNYATWNAYNNEYWPAEYLIDKKGIIRRTYFGEGGYDQTELAIQTLLKE
jgi:thiol-disulfide isomerase/thioredoxin